MYNKSGKKTALTIANDLYTISHSHVGKNNYLYRIFYYDCVQPGNLLLLLPAMSVI